MSTYKKKATNPSAQRVIDVGVKLRALLQDESIQGNIESEELLIAAITFLTDIQYSIQLQLGMEYVRRIWANYDYSSYLECEKKDPDIEKMWKLAPAKAPVKNIKKKGKK